MAVIDLDARRAARAEAENKPHNLILKGRTYQLWPRMPLEFTDLLHAGRMGEAMRVLLVNPDDWAEIRAAIPDDDDLATIAEAYAVSLPESDSSVPSSSNGSPSSKPISRSDIISISARSVMDQAPSGSADSTP